MIANEHNIVPFMKSLTSCLKKIVSDGYDHNFRVTEQGLERIGDQQFYHPEEIRIINFFRFEGESDPDDSAILYVIETHDGVKGTLIDAYGTYNDPRTSQFINHVTSFQKKG